MVGRKPALVIGALIGLSLSCSAIARDLGAMQPRTVGSGLRLAQYDGPPYGDPEDEGPAGYGPPPGYGGRGPGYDEADAPPRRSSRARRSVGGQHVNYHGFHIDLSEGGSSRNLAGEIAAMEHQIDLVGSVGLGMSDLQLFRALPIKISGGMRGGGHYDGGPMVRMGALKTSDRRPVLLHEYMHVYHHSHLPGGFQNPDIKAFYEEAVSRNLYPSGSYMLKNPGEFFAMTASCYLYGTVARPPFSRDAIRRQQPDYYAYLGRLFGPPHGTHSSGRAQARAGGRGPAYGRDAMDGGYN